MTESLRIEERPELRSPVLVAAFRGWNDGGQGASLAAGFLAKTWNAERFADIDPEEFFDFQVSRPKVSLVEGQTRRIDWPETVFYQAAIPGTERDAVLLLGIEPNMHWRTFCDLIVGLARDLGVELAVTLGSLLADVPQTAAYVEQLEQRSDELGTEIDLPSGETLAAELTRFLRERDEEDRDGEDAGPSAQ